MQTPVSIKLWKRGTIVETLNYSCLIHVYYGSFTQEIKKYQCYSIHIIWAVNAKLTVKKIIRQCKLSQVILIWVKIKLILIYKKRNI